jgi:hypothetical protein
VAISDENFERMLERAWRAIYDGVLMAEAQGRTFHVRKLKRAALIITETQNDLLATGALRRKADLAGRRHVKAGVETALTERSDL